MVEKLLCDAWHRHIEREAAGNLTDPAFIGQRVFVGHAARWIRAKEKKKNVGLYF